MARRAETRRRAACARRLGSRRRELGRVRRPEWHSGRHRELARRVRDRGGDPRAGWRGDRQPGAARHRGAAPWRRRTPAHALRSTAVARRRAGVGGGDGGREGRGARDFGGMSGCGVPRVRAVRVVPDGGGVRSVGRRRVRPMRAVHGAWRRAPQQRELQEERAREQGGQTAEARESTHAEAGRLPGAVVYPPPPRRPSGGGPVGVVERPTGGRRRRRAGGAWGYCPEGL